MSSIHRVVSVAVALSAVAMLVWRPVPSVVDAGPGAGAFQWLPGQPLPELQDGAKLALLVGIDDYPGDITDLRGCVEDVDLAAALLERRFGFGPEGIAVLRNQEATHENIVRAFDEWLIQRAEPDTQVLVWFSGHGSLVPDVDGEDELGQRDNTFLAWDSRKDHKGEYDLVDDEFRSLLAALTEVTENVTVITDSCHSGTLLRGGSDERPQSRSIPDGENPVDPALLAGFWPAEVERLDAAEVQLDPTRYVHLAACSPRQLAFEHRYEGDDGERKYQGALSFFLLDALQRCDPTISWERVAEEVRVRVNSRYHSQEVWCEGALDRRILGGGFAPPVEGFLGKVEGSFVTLEAGLVQRLYPGTRLDAFELADSGSDALGQVVVEDARELQALAEWDGEKPAGLADGTPLRTVVVERVPGAQMLYVQADPVELEDLLPESVGVVDDPLDADLLLRRLEGGELALYDAHGYLIWVMGREFFRAMRSTPKGRLVEVLERETSYRALVALGEEPGRFQIEAEFAESTDSKLLERFGSAQPEYDAQTGSYRALGGAGDDGLRLLELRVKNNEQFDLHVSVISLDEMRGRSPIYPKDLRNRNNLIEGGETRTIQVGLYVPDSWDEERPMRDRYLVVATRDFANFKPLLGVRMRSGVDPMPQPLRHALKGPVTRGMGSEKVEDPNWGILAVDVWVERDKR